MIPNTEKSVMLHLKQGTTDIHNDVEKVMPLMKDSLDLATYKKYLARAYGFFQTFESEFKSWPSEIHENFSLEDRRKLSMIEADLLALGETPETISAIPSWQNSNASKTPLTPAEVVGRLYVIEGSTLGGQLLAKAVKAKLQLEDSQVNFLKSYGANTGPMWKAFREAAENQVTESEYDLSLKAAKQSFADYGEAMSLH